MFRLVYRPPQAGIVILVALFGLSAASLFYYILTYSLTNERIYLTGLGVVLFALLINVYGWPMVWEVGAESVRMKVGRRNVADFPIRDIATVNIFVLGTNEVFQSFEIRGVDGGLLLRVEKGRLAIQDVRQFYEALAYYLRPYRISLRNPFGWVARLPEVPERSLPTSKPNWRRVVTHLALALVHGSGLGLAVGGAATGSNLFLASGIAIFVAGLGLWVVWFQRQPDRIRWWKGRK